MELVVRHTVTPEELERLYAMSQRMLPSANSRAEGGVVKAWRPASCEEIAEALQEFYVWVDPEIHRPTGAEIRRLSNAEIITLMRTDPEFLMEMLRAVSDREREASMGVQVAQRIVWGIDLARLRDSSEASSEPSLREVDYARDLDDAPTFQEALAALEAWKARRLPA